MVAVRYRAIVNASARKRVKPSVIRILINRNESHNKAFPAVASGYESPYDGR